MFTRRSSHVRGASSSSTAPPQQVFTQGIVFTDREARRKFRQLSSRKIKATKWALLLVACVGIFPEEEGMMQHSRDKYFPQL